MPDAILLDTNILADISRGHQKAADALRRHIDSGRHVYIAKAAYDELLKHAPNEYFRSHYREMVKDLGIRIAPAVNMPGRVGVYADNINHTPGPGKPGAVDEYNKKGTPGDVFIAAQAKTLNAQLWTHDKKFMTRAPQLGVKLAPECTLGGYSGTEDPARGRSLLRLQPKHVTGTGTVIQRPPGGSGTGGRGGGSGPPPGGAPPSARGQGVTGRPGTQARTGVADMRVPSVGGPSPRGTAIGGGIELLFRAINAAFGWATERQNKDKISQALQAYSAAIDRRDPDEGALLVIYYHEHDPVGPQRDSLIQPAPVFSHMEVYLGVTQSEAERSWHNQPAIRPARPGHKPKSSVLWFPPDVEPSMAKIATPFPRLHLASFVKGGEKLQDVEWGGVSGFDDMGQSKLSGDGMLFHVLQSPSTVAFYNGRYRHEVDIPLVDRKAGGGVVTLKAVDLDPFLGVFVAEVTAVPVFPANLAAKTAFDATRATRDNTGHLRNYTNIKQMRWVRPGNVEIL